MKDISYKIVYLTVDGAQRLFSNAKIANLPVVATNSVLFQNSVLYGEIYCAIDGKYIGSYLSSDAFSENESNETQKTFAVESYNSHYKTLKEKFPNYKMDFVNIDDILKVEKPKKTLTIEQRMKITSMWEELEKKSPLTLDEVRDIVNRTIK